MIEKARLGQRGIALILLMLSCAGCSDGRVPAEPAQEIAPTQGPEPTAEVAATPTGMLGQLVDLRTTLPDGYRTPPTGLDLDRAYGHVVRVGPGDPVLRFLVWTALPPVDDADGETMLAGYAVEVLENPGHHEITWHTVDDRGTEVDLRIRMERIEGTSLAGRVVEGTLAASDGVFTPTN